MGQRADQLGRFDRADDRDDDVREAELAAVPASGLDEDEDATQETEEIRAEIEQTRAEMGQTIDAIQERLRPERLMDEAKEQVTERVQEGVEQAKVAVRDATIGRVEDMVRNVGDTASDTRYTVVETVRANPLPAALAAIGLGWLFMNRRSAPSRRREYERDYRDYDRREYRGSGGYTVSAGTRAPESRQGDWGGYERVAARGYGAGTYGGATAYAGRGQERGGVGETVGQAREAVGSAAEQARDRVGEVAGQAQEKVGDVAGQAQERVGEMAGQVQESATNLAYQAGYQARQASDWFQDTLHESPLAVGAVALALGAVVGLAVPETEQEHQWMGEARDRLLDRASDVAQETMEKVQGVASEAKDAVSQAAENQGLTGGGGGGTGGSGGGTGGQSSGQSTGASGGATASMTGGATERSTGGTLGSMTGGGTTAGSGRSQG